MMDEELRKLLTNIDKSIGIMTEISMLNFVLDQRKYLTQKIRTGEAILDIGSYYMVVAGGGTFAISIANPDGWIWIAHQENVRLSQAAVFSLQQFRDDMLTPFITVPRACDGDFNWTAVVPYSAIIKDVASVSYTNNDIVPHWLVAGWMGTYLRKDVWERDFKAMDAAAQKYQVAIKGIS